MLAKPQAAKPPEKLHFIFGLPRSGSKLPMLAALFPNSKVIACVREMPWVLDSVERLVRKQRVGAAA